MISQETLTKLRQMKLGGMAEALQEQEKDRNYEELSFQERLGLLVDWEFTRRQHARLQRLIRMAQFHDSNAIVEDIRYDDDRKLDRRLMLELASCNYIPHARNVVIIGPTGAGKSYIAQALGHSACRRLLPTRYVHLSDLLEEMRKAREKSNEAYDRLRKNLLSVRLLIIDEWLLFPISQDDAQQLAWLIDRRYGRQATIVASQYEPAEWLDQIPIAVVAESITDRLVAQAHKIIIQGKTSMRSAI